jgi:hypothetical protein
MSESEIQAKMVGEFDVIFFLQQELGSKERNASAADDDDLQCTDVNKQLNKRNRC